MRPSCSLPLRAAGHSLVLVWLLAVGSCIARDVTEPSDHRPTTLLVQADVSATPVSRLVVDVTAPDIATPLAFNIPITNGVASGTITIPAGSNRTIAMHAFDAGGVETHSGSVTINIQPGANPTVTIVLNPLTGTVPISVTLGSFVVTVTPTTDTLSAGDTVTLTAAIYDGTGSPVTGRVEWATLSPGVATVVGTGPQTGRVTAVRDGEATVIATYGGAAGAATIVVRPILALQLVSEGLTQPLYVASPPGDTSRIFVVQQNGKIAVFRHDTLLATPFLDIGSLITFSGERGLLSMAFHPSYAANGQFFVDYVDLNSNIQVARYTVSADPNVADPASGQIILSITHDPSTNHYGGLVLFGPDGYLYIGVGDGGTGGANGQDSTTLLGKILRIDVNAGSPYAIPPNNPFVGRPPAAPEVWAYGLRNPWRFAFDPVAHDLYIADVGENLMEEVDIQPSWSAGGENYGWNTMEGTLCFSPPTGCNQTGLVPPVYTYVHGLNDLNGCSIIGGFVYQGSRIPALAGRYFYADLCGNWIKSFRFRNGLAADSVDYSRHFGLISAPTSFGQDGRGELYVTTFYGNVWRIVSR